MTADRGGDAEQIELRRELAERHRDAFARALNCCRRNRTEAEEVLQATYLKLLEGRETVKALCRAAILGGGLAACVGCGGGGGGSGNTATPPPPPPQAFGTRITAPVSVKLNRIPDQAEIIFLQDGYRIYVMDRGGAHVTQITFERPRQYEHVAVSPDRRFVVANEQLPNPTHQPGGKSVIWLYDLERGTEAQLVPDFKTAGNGGVDWDASGFIYFAAQEKDVVANPQTPDDHIKNAVANDVYKIRHDGTGLLRLTQTADGGEADVGVSPDGSLVSYIKEVIDLSSGNHTEVWVMNADGSNPRMVYKGGLVKQASVHDPEISPDNKQVAFSKVNPDFKNFRNDPAANTAHDLYVTNLDGTGLRRLTRPGPISVLPNWKDSLILYTELNEAARYGGSSIVNDQGIDQLPERVRAGPWAPNWIPQASAGRPSSSPKWR